MLYYYHDVRDCCPDVCNFEMVSASSVKNLDFYNCRITTVTLKHLLVNNEQNILVLIMKN